MKDHKDFKEFGLYIMNRSKDFSIVSKNTSMKVKWKDKTIVKDTELKTDRDTMDTMLKNIKEKRVTMM